MSVKDYYRGVLRDIMSEHRLQPLQSSPTAVVGTDAQFDDVLRHTDWFVNTGDTKPHYRYRRYLEMLEHMNVLNSSVHLAHFDIGCGAGLFSWAFLDWAAGEGVEFDRVELFGFDHSRAMIELAESVRDKLVTTIPNYPILHYSDRSGDVIGELEQIENQDITCVITLGHVLAQVRTHTPDDINHFAQIIGRVRSWMDTRRSCILIGIDAQGASAAFLQGWDLLLERLDEVTSSCV